jgi:UDP-N-acetylglucosamine--N-acetylmuramyl-(pentapeptide) pyrophosphoryl-undecaprenol N-acetylglucosamine transferase
MSRADAPVLIMAGGTGGHIFPGLAIAAELKRRGVPVVWLGAHGGLETNVVPANDIALETLPIGGVRGKGLAVKLAAPLRIARAIVAAIGTLRRVRPRSALSMGGYAAGPGGIAAWLLRIPLVVHEQNRVPGATNRVLSLFARQVLAGFPDAFKPSYKLHWIGNPVRDAIAALPAPDVPAPDVRYAAHDAPPRVLVLGGSLGARALNERVPAAIAALPSASRPRVRHQCGAKHVDDARAAYDRAGVAASVEPFIDDMAAAYAWADLVICRAGALTIAELSAAGVGAVLVPYPHAVDDHQTRNAAALVDAGAAMLLPESDAEPARIAVVLAELLSDRARLLSMAQAARTLAKPDAAAHIVDHCLEVAS